MSSFVYPKRWSDGLKFKTKMVNDRYLEPIQWICNFRVKGVGFYPIPYYY